MPQPVHNAIVTPHNDPHLCLKPHIFWPPRTDEKEKLYDLGRLFMVSPECDFGASEWLAKQEAKLEGLENA